MCIGRIEDIRPVAELPEVAAMPVEMARSVLTEWGVTRVAMISYYTYPNCQLMFAALEIGGSWFDLSRQELGLEVVGQFAI